MRDDETADDDEDRDRMIGGVIELVQDWHTQIGCRKQKDMCTSQPSMPAMRASPRYRKNVSCVCFFSDGFVMKRFVENLLP